MKHLRSFTIIELVVVLTISGIVIIMAIWFIQLGWKNFGAITINASDANKSYAFINNLKLDVYSSDKIEYINATISIYKNGTLKGEYILENNMLIKQTREYADTFPLQVERIDTTCIYSLYNGIFVTSIVLDVTASDSIESFLFVKKYDNQILYDVQSRLK